MTDKRTGRLRITYSPRQLPNGAVDVDAFAVEASASGLSQHPASIRAAATKFLVLTFSSGISEEDLQILDQLVANHSGGSAALVEAKQWKNAAIDRRTESLILSGSFEYPTSSGQFFSLSERAQLNILSCYNSRARVGWSYPVLFMTKDNGSSVSLADASEVEAFYSAAEDAKRSIRESGVALKNQVNAAANKAAVSAVADNR